MLNLSGITPAFYTNTKFVIKKCVMYSVYMFTIYLHTKFHMPSSNGSLLTVFKLKTKYRF